MNSTVPRVCVEESKTCEQSNAHSSVSDSELTPESTKRIGFIAHPDFHDPSRIGLILEKACGDDRTATGEVESNSSKIGGGSEATTGQHFASILTRDQERKLFLRMNGLKALAEEYRRRAERNLAPATCLRKMTSLLECANAARSKIAAADLRLVRPIARSFTSDGNSRDELFCEGNAVLLKTIDSFDALRCFRFSTYATHSVRRHLARAVIRQRRPTQDIQAAGHVEPAIENDDADRIDEESLAVIDHMLTTALPKSGGSW